MQGSPQASFSLSDILDETVPQQLTFDLSTVDLGRLTLMEIYDLCEAAGVEPEGLMAAVQSSGAVRARVVYAAAWVILRRKDRSLTFETVSQYDLTIEGEMQNTINSDKRAKSAVAVAALAGVSTEEAAQMTMAEIHEVTELAERRNRAARRKR